MSQQKQISQTERFRAENALDVLKHIRAWRYIFCDEASHI